MAAEVGQIALIAAGLAALVAVTAGVTVVLVRRRDAARANGAPKPVKQETPAGLLDRRTLISLAVVLAVVFGLAALAMQFGLGAKAPPTAALPPGHPEVDPGAMIPGLEAKLAKAPDDAEGWRMLGWAQLQVGHSAEAAQAYGKAAAIDPRNAEYASAEGEATVLAAGGEVTPAAEAAFVRAVRADPRDPRALYYLALAKDQKGDADGAMRDWLALLAAAPPDAPWVPQVRAFVEKVARDRKIDLAGRLPTGPAAPASAAGPTPDQVASANRMSAEDQQAMIAGMVSRLADRLRTNPRDLDGWRRLMRARMVMGQPEAAVQAYREGSKAFAGAPAEQAALRQSAASLGLPGF